jgi:CheY-like chemotaxis protein
MKFCEEPSRDKQAEVFSSEDVEQRSGTPVPPAAADRFARLRAARGLLCLIFALWIPAATQAADAYDDVLDRQLAPNPNVTALERALLAEGKMMAQAPEVEPPPSTIYNGLVVAVASLFAGALAFLNWRFNPLKLFRAPAVADLPDLAVEDPGLAAFFNELRDGLNASTHPSVGPLIHSLNGIHTHWATDPVEALIDSAPGRIAGFRALFSELSRAPDAGARQKLLVEFSDQVRALKDGSRMPALHPVWLMASALEGLLTELSREASEFTPSSRRTAAGAVDLLEALCVPGLNPKLATEPPVRILTVDDDAVSRLAMTFALKKAFNVPNVAPEGETALALAVQHIYDVIFLDVEMPGMDGFELCTKIHETVRNRATPVVFVTAHSDFNSRAKSSVSGGRDLIGKPFLAFEITVKALTLALRGRLQNGAIESRFARAADEPAPALPAIASAAMGPSLRRSRALRRREKRVARIQRREIAVKA